MPPRGVEKGTKRARQYEHIKDSPRAGRFEERAKEIAARTVNKERARSGEARESSRLSREDISSGRRGGPSLQSQGAARAYEGAALRGGAQARRVRPVEDEQGGAQRAVSSKRR